MSRPTPDLLGRSAADFDRGPWLNSPPLSLPDLRGKVLLVNFWAYSCVNCLRQIPRLRDWHDSYGPFGLVVVGVHTPEYEFERSLPNVAHFVRERALSYPIVLDNKRRIWKAYRNRFWPHVYLVDAAGRIRYDREGEGGYSQIELAIRELLVEASPRAQLPPSREAAQPGVPEVCLPATTEVLAGFERDRLGNPGGYRPDGAFDYGAPKSDEAGRLYLGGVWEARPDHVRQARPGGDPANFAAAKYQAFEVDAVLGLSSGSEAKLLLTRDGRPLPPEAAGRDVVAENVSCVVVREPRAYNLVRDRTFGSHLLKLQPLGDHLELYALAFGGCASDVD